MIRAEPVIRGKGLYAEAKEVPFLSPPVHSGPSSQGATNNLRPPRMSPAEKAAIQRALAIRTSRLLSRRVPAAKGNIWNEGRVQEAVPEAESRLRSPQRRFREEIPNAPPKGRA